MNIRIFLVQSSNNRFYHNNFRDNIQQVFIFPSGYANYWDDGFEGNYWSDYNPPDLDGDGIGDTPYVIDESNRERYPLIYPYGFVPSPDLDDDRIVDINDLIIWTNVWGSQPGYPTGIRT